MEDIGASRPVGSAELKRSSSAVLEPAGLEAVSMTNRNRPEAHLVSPHIDQAMAGRVSADLRGAIREGVDSGPAIPAGEIFKELGGRYAGSEMKNAVRELPRSGPKS
jgi:hypothetical protein